MSKRKTPPTKLKPLAETRDYIYHRDEGYVYISDSDEYYVGKLIGYSFAYAQQPGGYIFDSGTDEGLVEWTDLGGRSLYPVKDRYNEILEYFKENDA